MTHLENELDLYTMANLSRRLTGLPFVVWISQRGFARHDVRVKVSYGPKMTSESIIASVSIRPEPEVVEGQLAPYDLTLLRAWIKLNAEVLILYWDGELYTEEALSRLKPIKAENS